MQLTGFRILYNKGDMYYVCYEWVYIVCTYVHKPGFLMPGHNLQYKYSYLQMALVAWACLRIILLIPPHGKIMNALK